MDGLQAFFEQQARKYGFAYAIRSLPEICGLSDREAEQIASDRLTPDERSEYPVSAVRKRRDEWLGGRLAAKEALVRAGVSARGSADAGPFSVLAGENRAPYVRGRPGTNVSISHSHEYAVAVVAPFRIGVDLERIEPRPSSLADYFCSPAERRRLATGCGSKEESDALMTFLWSRKEAVAKFFEEGSRLRFSALDTLEDIVRVEGRAPSGVRLVSGTADGYCITIAL